MNWVFSSAKSYQLLPQAYSNNLSLVLVNEVKIEKAFERDRSRALTNDYHST